MSGLITGLVWELQCNERFKPDDKYIALAYADHAWQDGTNAFPSIEHIATKTGKSERAVQRHIRNLEALGLLILAGQGPRGTNKYNFPLRKREDGTPYLYMKEGCQNDGVTKTTPGGVSPVAPEGMTPEGMTPEPKVVVKNLTTTTTGNAPNVFEMYSANFGAITQMTKDQLIDLVDTYTAEWVVAAMVEAVRAEARRINYVDSILRRWRVDGFKVNKKQTKTGPPARGRSSPKLSNDDFNATLQEIAREYSDG